MLPFHGWLHCFFNFQVELGFESLWNWIFCLLVRCVPFIAFFLVHKKARGYIDGYALWETEMHQTQLPMIIKGSHKEQRCRKHYGSLKKICLFVCDDFPNKCEKCIFILNLKNNTSFLATVIIWNVSDVSQNI